MGSNDNEEQIKYIGIVKLTVSHTLEDTIKELSRYQHARHANITDQDFRTMVEKNYTILSKEYLITDDARIAFGKNIEKEHEKLPKTNATVYTDDIDNIHFLLGALIRFDKLGRIKYKINVKETVFMPHAHTYDDNVVGKHYPLYFEFYDIEDREMHIEQEYFFEALEKGLTLAEAYAQKTKIGGAATITDEEFEEAAKEFYGPAKNAVTSYNRKGYPWPESIERINSDEDDFYERFVSLKRIKQTLGPGDSETVRELMRKNDAYIDEQIRKDREGR